MSDGVEVVKDLDVEVVAAGQEALCLLGSAWRGDWSDFDGRTLRAQLQEASDVFAGKLTLENFLSLTGICPRGHWTFHCSPDCVTTQKGTPEA